MESLESRCNRLEDYISTGRLLRHEWSAVRDGKQYACLLAALSPEVLDYAKDGPGALDVTDVTEVTDSCPVDLMPKWMADLTVWIDDGGTGEVWPDVIRRFAATIRKSRTPVTWARAEREIKKTLLRMWASGPSTDHEMENRVRRAAHMIDRDLPFTEEFMTTLPFAVRMIVKGKLSAAVSHGYLETTADKAIDAVLTTLEMVV